MAKTQGFKITATFFLPVDKKNFTAQRDAYGLVAGIQESNKLPDDFLSRVTLIDVSAKQGGHELPAASGGNVADPALTPLTTDPLPEGATIVDSVAALDDSIFQNITLAGGTASTRRISAKQFKKEGGTLTA
jgi:hypothetical protein